MQEYRLVPVEEWEERQEEDTGIDFVELATSVWNHRFFIAKIACVFMIIGLLIAFLSPVEFESSVVLLPEVNNESSLSGAKNLLKNYSGMLGFGGGDLFKSSSQLSVDLYPEIVNSLSFQDRVLSDSIYIDNLDINTNLYTYFQKLSNNSLSGFIYDYTIALPYRLKYALFNDEIKHTFANKDSTLKTLSLTIDEMKTIERFRKRINVSIDNDDGKISIISEMPTPLLAAKVNTMVITKLKQFITKYRIEKASSNLKFIKEQYNQSELRFKNVQKELANFKDENKNIATSKAEIEGQRLQSEYDLTYNLYNNLAQQLEQARIKVQEKTPVFSLLQPITIPAEKSKPQRTLIILVSVILGIILSIAVVLIPKFLNLNFFLKGK